MVKNLIGFFVHFVGLSEHYIYWSRFPKTICYHNNLYHYNMIATMIFCDSASQYFYFKCLTYFFFSQPTGSLRTIKDISIREMLPDIKYYMTYEGSTTHPGCWETTVWIVLNKPIYITRREVSVYTHYLYICIFYYMHTR